MRRGIRELIEQQPDLEVCAEAANPAETWAAIEKHHPTLITMDLSLEEGEGLNLIASIRARYPEIPIFVVSMHENLLLVERALRVGAQGYLKKREASERLIVGIREILNGEIYICDVVAAKMLREYASGHASVRQDSVQSLTDRELEVFRMIGRGRKTADIAHDLHLSVKTVEYHRSNIRQKLHLKDAHELLYGAVQWEMAQKAASPQSDSHSAQAT
jgi:DNA-binding NarL/FixJ family response regulator